MKDQEKSKDQLMEELARLRQRLAELEKGEGERQPAEEALKRQQKMLQQIIDKSHTHLVYLDPDFNFVAVNAAYARTCHRTPEELIGKNHFFYYPHEENEAIFQRVKETGEAASFSDKPFVFPDQPERGTTYWDWTLSPVKDESGRLEGLVFSLVDTTERKKAEMDLEQVRNLLSEAQKIAHLGSFAYDVAAKQATWSDEEYRIFGLDQEGPRPTLDVMLRCVHPDDALHVQRIFISAMEARSVYELEYRIVRPDGGVRWVRDRAQPYFDEHGRLVRYVGTTLDITDRKQAEESLRASEERFRLFMDNSPTIAWMKDEEGRYVYLNKTYQERFAVRPEDWLGKTDAELWPAAVAEEFRKNNQAVLSGGQPVQVLEEAPNPGGSSSYWLSCKFPFRDSAGNRFVAAVGIDITERKRLEDELRQAHDGLEAAVRERTGELAASNVALALEIAEHKRTEAALKASEAAAQIRKAELEALIEAIPAPVWVSYDPQCRVIRGNRAAAEILGLPPEQVNLSASSQPEGLPAFEVWRGLERLQSSQMTMQLATATGRPVLGDELKFVRSDGSARWAYGNAIPLFSPEGEIRGCVCVFLDITDLKTTERTLRESEATARTLLNIPNAIAFLVDRAGIVLDAGETLFAKLSVRRSDVIGKPIWDFLSEEVSRRRKAYFDEAVRTRRVVRFDDERKGTWFETIVRPILNEVGEVSLMSVLAFDITERRQAKEDLKKLADQRQLALDAANLGWWHYDPLKKIAILDSRFGEVFGVTDNQCPNDEILKLLHPDDLPGVWAKVEAALDPSDPKPYHAEYRICRGDGSLRWVEAHGIAMFEGEGQSRHAASFVGTVRDITERKRAEEELQEKSEHLAEVNAALRFLLRQRDEDKKEFEETVMSNFRHLVMPYVESLKKSHLSTNQRSWLEILESSLNQISAPFARRLTLRELNLSNAELRVAALVRDGKRSKEIAEILGIAEKTVLSHRDSIRAKLGLRGKKGGLRYLLTNLG